jgi:hypothetical protein
MARTRFKIVYREGVNFLGLTATRFSANTSAGTTTTIIIPSVEEIQSYMEEQSGIEISGTFSYAFEKVGNGTLIFKVNPSSDGTLDTINGVQELVINEVGSGIIFITSNTSWGIVHLSKSSSEINIAKKSISMVEYLQSSSINPIYILPPKQGSLIIPTHMIITVTESDATILESLVSYGYPNGIIGDINLSGLPIGSRIVVPITSPQNYTVGNNPIGKGVIVYKKSGKVGFDISMPTFEVLV